MNATRNRSAWIWLAAAVMVVATVARAEVRSAGSAAYAHPVLEFFAGHQVSSALSTHSSPQPRRSMQAAGSSVWQAMLPVLFIGLAAPLSLVAFRSNLLSSRVPAAPALSSAFQRPPPAQLA